MALALAPFKPQMQEGRVSASFVFVHGLKSGGALSEDEDILVA